MDFTVWSHSASDTYDLGEKLGACLQHGDVLALYGELGAGKTALCQGIARALGINEPVVSPTYTLIHEYQGMKDNRPVKLIHMDLYRLQHPEEAEIIGVGDAFQPDTICLVEWPEVGEDLLPGDCLTLKIEGAGELPRKITFSAQTSEWGERLKPIMMIGEKQ